MPSRIDLREIDNPKSTVNGHAAVQNFLQISWLDTSILRDPNSRNVKKHLNAVENKISSDFQKFWSQQIGDSGRIHFSCSLKHHSIASSGAAGEPYLEFAIMHSEDELLYPHQRSRGVIWYLSFFLQLMAKSIDGRDQLILIDEPGSNLHGKAQEDVLNLFESLKDQLQILYSTHSPYLIQVDKLYRVLAVQRGEIKGGYLTAVMTAHQLASASVDTLMPIYTAMGLNLTQIPLVLQSKNILLEEISCLYYLKSFYRLLSRECKFHFLPAQGVTNVPTLANLLLGWGLKFGVVLDDDSEGRKIFNKLKVDLFMNKDELASVRLKKLPFSGGIENVFSRDDFLKFVVGEAACNKSRAENHEMVKNSSKGMIAGIFCIKVSDGKINWTDLSKETQDSINQVVNLLESLEV